MFVTFSDSFRDQICFLTLELDRLHAIGYLLGCLQVGLINKKFNEKCRLILLIGKLKRIGLRLYPFFESYCGRKC